MVKGELAPRSAGRDERISKIVSNKLCELSKDNVGIRISWVNGSEANQAGYLSKNWSNQHN